MVSGMKRRVESSTAGGGVSDYEDNAGILGHGAGPLHVKRGFVDVRGHDSRIGGRWDQQRNEIGAPTIRHWCGR